MRLITWNVARRVQALPGQAVALAGREPDVVALQEVTAGTWPVWRDAFARIGLPHVRCTLDGADPAREPISRRRTGVVLAARSPLEDADRLPVPWPETTLAARIDGVVVHVVHVPNAANGRAKVDTLAGVRAGIAAGSGPRVLCGDLNTPRREMPDGTVIPFAPDSNELGLVPGLRDFGFADAFRAVHGYASREPSWTWRRIAGHGGGYRIDHLFASAELEPVAAGYHHEWRDSGLSDHAALEADVQARPSTSTRA